MRIAVLALVLAASAGCATETDSTNMSDADAAGAPASEAAAAGDALSPEATAALASLREATAKYEDVNVAIADGFMQDPSGMCVTADMVGLPAEQGAMGIHYVQPARLGLQEGPPVGGTDGALDWMQPEVLTYEPQADGTMKLAALEYLVFTSAWESAGNTAPPDFHGTPFVAMADDPATPADEAHGFAPHYELHVWLPRENPSGVFAEFNPNVTCQHVAGQPSGG